MEQTFRLSIFEKRFFFAVFFPVIVMGSSFDLILAPPSHNNSIEAILIDKSFEYEFSIRIPFSLPSLFHAFGKFSSELHLSVFVPLGVHAIGKILLKIGIGFAVAILVPLSH